MTYDDLLDIAYNSGLQVKEESIRYDGCIKGKDITINKAMPTRYKKCALAEEMAHAGRNVGDIVDQSKIENQRQEYKARALAYEKIVPVENIRFAITDGYRTYHEVAEYIDVSVEFLVEAISYYQSKGLI